MGKSGVINRGELKTDKTFEKGYGIVTLVSGSTCGSKNIVMGHTTHYPGSRNQAHIHKKCEVMWFQLSGHALHYSSTIARKEYTETECFPGTVGFVAPYELHPSMNLEKDKTGEVVFFYAGVNEKEDAGTVFYDDESIVIEYLKANGKKLEDF